ncbi:hypothetical protein PHJA_002441400 [Phtheirospermum japonicum]|uniref:Uncharacterized protein n=1 Tax=Phtheirospermum japonicum TaxID=374723 RepID=A0A830D770_9LAMI|nr:hypothetical protein PHJA_002441400 [Phtheirospermum japonicum]
MAQEMDDLEFLLPSELLTDDDLLTDFGCGFGNSSGLSSDLSSPVESVTGSTETGSDEDDFVSELTRKLTHSTLRDPGLSYDYAAKGVKLSGSPQSTLCGFKLGSRGSPNSESRVCSPQEAKDALSWDLLYAAAEEVARMRMVEETAAFYSSRPIGPAHKLSPVSVPQPKHSQASGFYSNQAQAQTHLSYQQLQAAKFQQMMGQGHMEYLLQRDGGGDRGYGLSMSAWPTLQQSQQRQQTGSGMKPVFLGETGPKKERVGTGVFMPRRFGSNPTETRKKPVLHAMNMDSMDAPVQHRGVGNFTTEFDSVSKHRNNNVMMAYQRRNLRSQPLMNQEFRLPQEWTY